jgi:hypothetical protein
VEHCVSIQTFFLNLIPLQVYIINFTKRLQHEIPSCNYVLKLTIIHPITFASFNRHVSVAAGSKGVGLGCLDTGIVGSNPTHCMDGCPRLSALCCPVSVQALRWADFPCKESCQMSKTRFRNLTYIRRPRFSKNC